VHRVAFNANAHESIAGQSKRCGIAQSRIAAYTRTRSAVIESIRTPRRGLRLQVRLPETGTGLLVTVVSLRAYFRLSGRIAGGICQLTGKVMAEGTVFHDSVTPLPDK